MFRVVRDDTTAASCAPARSLLYYTYFTVVRRALDIFSCTLNDGGVYTLDADPSVRCWAPGSGQAALLPWALLSLVGYGGGVPAAIAFVLRRYRARMAADQTLWLAGRGDTGGSNPDWSIRRRFAKLYQVSACRARVRACTRACVHASRPSDTRRGACVCARVRAAGLQAQVPVLAARAARAQVLSRRDHGCVGGGRCGCMSAACETVCAGPH